MAAEEEILLHLFDSYWFEHEIFTSKPPLSTNLNPVLQIHDQEELEEPINLQSRIPTLHVRSFSDQFLSSRDKFSSDSLSPNSVLHTPKLQTILSGEEVGEFSDRTAKKEEKDMEMLTMKKRESGGRRGRKGKGSSKSLSELEFEELKGFMDLGFVFSEEDRDSSLVSIIPGLQRLGKEVKIGDGDDDEEEEEVIDESEASRPYLSEAWGVWGERKAEKPLMNLRLISDIGNEMDMKDQLRFWAHSVASAVR